MSKMNFEELVRTNYARDKNLQVEGTMRAKT